MSNGPEREFASVERELGGETVTFYELDWMETADFTLKLFDMAGGVRSLATFYQQAGGELNFVFLLAVMHGAVANKQATAEVFAAVTDKEPEWFLTPKRLGQDDLVEMVEAMLDVVPFARLLSRFKALAARFNERFAEAFGTSSESSDGGTDGDQSESDASPSDDA